MTPPAQLVGELNVLLRLTRLEAAVARSRVPLARDRAVRQELLDNAAESERSAQALAGAIRELGGVPDLVGSTLARVGALVKTGLEQGQTLPDALLGDLALEHQLVDRARLGRALAETAGYQSIAELLADVEADHLRTVAWIEAALREVATGQSPRLRPTPVQRVVGAGRRVLFAGVRSGAAAVNRALTRGEAAVAGAGDRVIDLRERVVEPGADAARDAAREAARTARQGLTSLSDSARSAAREAASAARDGVTSAADSARDTAASAADTVADSAEEVADRAEQVADGAEQEADRTTEASGDASPRPAARRGRRRADADLPIQRYDDLTADQAMLGVRALDDVDQLRAVLAHERARKGRRTVITAAEARESQLAAERSGAAT